MVAVCLPSFYEIYRFSGHGNTSYRGNFTLIPILLNRIPRSAHLGGLATNPRHFNRDKNTGDTIVESGSVCRAACRKRVRVVGSRRCGEGRVQILLEITIDVTVLEDNSCPERRAILPIVSLPDSMGVPDTEGVVSTVAAVGLLLLPDQPTVYEASLVGCRPLKPVLSRRTNTRSRGRKRRRNTTLRYRLIRGVQPSLQTESRRQRPESTSRSVLKFHSRDQTYSVASPSPDTSLGRVGCHPSRRDAI